MAAEDQDKTEQPTQYRLEEARRRGEVAKSSDAVGTAMLIVFAATFALTGAWVAHALASAIRDTLLFAGGKPAPGAGLFTWMGVTWSPVWRALSPLALALVVTAAVANIAQTGPVFTSHPIKPDFNRMNPAQTLKRLFSVRTLWELGKMVLKLGLLTVLAYAMYRQLTGLAGGIASASPQRLPRLAMTAFAWTSIYVLLILAALAAVDLLVVRREYMRKMRMSRRDLRDEHKRRDGDPEIKSKQKRLIRELLKKARSVPRVAEADFVLTNPTHYAVALQYRPATMRAPIVLAKGAGFMSKRIRSVAQRHGVPILRRPALTRALYRECELDAPVPEARYEELAPVYRWLFARRGGERFA
ncbi:EscU/YscU/HrcU family type III secretion system export apparatus switch protein [Thermomonas sp.]|uniref:EscU/YscU/HrcU family type III secretion system export apparatus switch protein n=1 Tax=Thermomonas sp. TaxID=1971895 RepID=UPI002CA32DB6|nr:EscU/YscU/HrcU family type III secretion system export apparatus switch protein [Thermomonas sp.]HRO63602.1 EscU/YscU/HrcU family type III secretion system export apparatus switch protein [Thermomonas sp.]